MPPKKKPEDEESEEEADSEETESTESTESSSEEDEEEEEEEEAPKNPPPKAAPKAVPKPSPASIPAAKAPLSSSSPGGGAQTLHNKPHDEEFEASEGEHRKTPPGGRPGAAGRPGVLGGVQSPPKAGTQIANKHHDEELDASDNSITHVRTPPNHAQRPAGANKFGASPGSLTKGNTITNAPHDEEFDAGDAGGHATPPSTGKGQRAGATGSLGPVGGGNSRLHNTTHDEEFRMDDGRDIKTPEGAKPKPKLAPQKVAPKVAPKKTLQSPPKKDREQGDTSSSSSDSEEDSGPPAAAGPRGGRDDTQGGGLGSAAPDELVKAPVTRGPASPSYNPKDYANLNVSREVKDLFLCITQFQPTNVELSAKLHPFIPDFIPAVGDIDAFCKVPRPDNKSDKLGLGVVDEPCANQSNPAVVLLELKQLYTIIGAPSAPAFVDSVEDAHNRPQVLDKWVVDIAALHAKSPPIQVSYTKPMPEIERLLQIWPPEMEDLLSNGAVLPPAQLDVDLIQYTKILCAFLDIPTHGNLVESLHVMFTLFMDFKANQHFQHAATRL